MGYCTEYTLSILNGTDTLIEKLREVNEEAFHALFSNGQPNHSTKWYEHESDLMIFSLGYPNIIFQLKGAGDDKGDLWVKYFMNGKMQHGQASIVYEPFDKDLFR